MTDLTVKTGISQSEQVQGLQRPLRVAIPGGAGQVGRILAAHLHAKGSAVTILSRRAVAAPWRTVLWDGEGAGEWTKELEGADVVLNLAGRSVNCRYNARNRRE